MPSHAPNHWCIALGLINVLCQLINTVPELVASFFIEKWIAVALFSPNAAFCGYFFTSLLLCFIQSMRHKPCPVLSGWWQQTRSTQGGSIRIPDHAYQPLVPAKGGGSGMQAIFLEPNGSGRESGGTGVFLPRRIGNSNSVESKKKKKSGGLFLSNHCIAWAICVQLC